MKTRIDKDSGWIIKVLGFGFMISLILKNKGVKGRSSTMTHRTHYYMGSNPPNYVKRKAEEIEATEKAANKKSKSKATKDSGEKDTAETSKSHDSNP